MTTPRPQDTDPLRAKGTDREPWAGWDGADERAAFTNLSWRDQDRLIASLYRRPWYRRLVAWVRKWRRP